MPLHLNDLDVGSEVAGLRRVLIVPCNMCPAVSAAVDADEPFLRLFRSAVKSAPFEARITALQARLGKSGVDSSVFRSTLYHHWFLCMWTAGRRRKLRDCAKGYDAVIVLGCDSAVETVREAVESTDCKVITGMEAVGFTNAKLKFSLPCNVSFEDCRTVPISRPSTEEHPSD